MLPLGEIDADGDVEALGDRDAEGEVEAEADDAASYNATNVEIVELVPSVNSVGPAHDSLVVVRMRVWQYHETAAALFRDRLSNCSV